MRTRRFPISGFSFVCLLLSGPIAAAQAPGTYMYCYGSAAGTPQYHSTPFQVDRTSFVNGRSSFIKHLEQKYNFKGLVQCTSPRTLEVAQAELKKVADNIQRGMNLKIETDWVYSKVGVTPPAAPPAPAPAASSASSAPSTPAPPAPPAPSAPSAPSASSASSASSPTAPVQATTHAVCWADFDPQTRYYSAVFDGTKGDYADWMPSFKGYLYGKYKYTKNVRCTKKPSKAEAQQYWDDMVAAARGLTLAGGVKPRIIETGWAYP